MSEVDKKLEAIEKSISSIKSTRQWKIAVASALVAAIASIAAAFLGYLGTKRSIEVDRSLGELNAKVTIELGTLARKLETQRLEVEKNKISLDVYKHFGTIIASGKIEAG